MSRARKDHPPKLRKDSPFAALTLPQKDRVFALYQQHGSSAPALILAELGAKCSVSGLSAFCSVWPFRKAHLEAANFADNFKKLLREIPDLKLDAKQLDATAQAVFEADSVRNMDLSGFARMKGLRQRDRELVLSERRVKVLEAKAALADQARDVVRSDIPVEEQNRRLREILK